MVSGTRHGEPTVDLISGVLTREATRTRGDAGSPYSWGTTLRVAPGHARETAAAVLAALHRAGRLMTAGQLAEFGRYGWAAGFVAGGVVGKFAGQFGWPWWAEATAAYGSFAVGLWLIGCAARRAVARNGGGRG